MKSKVMQRFSLLGVLVGFTLAGCSGSPTGASGNGSAPTVSVIDGTVMNTSGQGLSAVRVSMASTGRSTTTNGQGRFRLMTTQMGQVQMNLQQGAMNAAVTLQNVRPGQMLQVAMQVNAAGQVLVTSDNRNNMPSFDGNVASVDQVAQTLTLQGGQVVRVDANTVWYNDDGDGLQSLAQVAAALAAGQTVEAEGYGMPDANGVLLAMQIEAEVDNDNDDDD